MAQHLTLSGAAGVYARTPTTTGLDVTNDLDIMVQVRADLATPTLERTLIGRRESASTNNLIYRLYQTNLDNLVLEWTTAADVDMTAAATVNINTIFANRGSDLTWLRATLDVDNGASGYDAKFWYSRDVTDDPDAATFTQLGATVTVAGVTNIIDGRSSGLEIGSYNTGTSTLFTGDVFRGVVRDGIGGTIIADFNAEDFTLGDTSGATANDSTGKTWTVNGAAIITNNPVIAGTAESSVVTAGTSHTITLPAGGEASDETVILTDIGVAVATFNSLTDWTELLDENVTNGLTIWRYTGAGVPSNPTFTSSGATRSATIALRIHGADKTTAPQIATTGTGTSVSPDPPSITPTGGTSKDYLSIAFFGMAGEENDDDTWCNSAPTNWLPAIPWQKACGTAGTALGGLIAAAYRQITTGSALDPGTFNVDVSAAWRSQQVLIHPAVAGPNEGAATGTIAWVGSATGTNVHSGSATGAITWAGAATGTNVHSGSASGTISWAGTADGKEPAGGLATGTITWAGSATGEAPADVFDGEGIGAITWAGSAQGTNVHSGSASGSITWAGSAQGAVAHRGASAGAITWAGTAGGTSVHSGSANGALSWAGTSTGATTKRGSGSGSITWAGTATGTAPPVGVKDGEGTGTISWAGTSAGTTQRRGQAVGTVAWVGAATGTAPPVAPSVGAATGTVSWAGTAEGTNPHQGSAVGSILWAGEAFGPQIPAGDLTITIGELREGWSAGSLHREWTTDTPRKEWAVAGLHKT